MKSAMLLVPTIALLGACQQPQQVEIKAPWVRLAAVSGNPSAAYFTLTGGPRDETLTGVTSSAAVRSEMHESVVSNGVTSMAAVKLVAVRADGTVTFAPGGKHLMLFGLRPDAKVGGTIPLTFSFASGRTVTAQARLIGPADPAPGE